MRSGNDKKVVCADCRFPNEIAAIQLLSMRTIGKKVGKNHKFVFCNYRSNRYDAMNVHKSEHMAQEFLKRKFKDLQDITELI